MFSWNSKYCSLLSFWFKSNLCSVISGEWAVILILNKKKKQTHDSLKRSWVFFLFLFFFFTFSSQFFQFSSVLPYFQARATWRRHHIRVLSSCNEYAFLLGGASVMSRWHLRIARGKKLLAPFLRGMLLI